MNKIKKIKKNLLYRCWLCWWTHNGSFCRSISNLEIKVVDTNKLRIDAWNDKDLNKLPIFEPGLDEIILRVRNKNLFLIKILKNQ